MKHLLIIFSILMLFVGCAKTVYVPTEAKTIIEYRDTTIYIKDTVRVEVPTEAAESKTPTFEPSHLETSIAESDAWVDGDKLHHTLKNKKTTLKTKVDTVFTVTYVDRYIEKPVIETVEVEKPYIPTWAWIIICYAALISGLTIMRIIGKFR